MAGESLPQRLNGRGTASLRGVGMMGMSSSVSTVTNSRFSCDVSHWPWRRGDWLEHEFGAKPISFITMRECSGEHFRSDKRFEFL
jgi:hypothetical protein